MADSQAALRSAPTPPTTTTLVNKSHRVRLYRSEDPCALGSPDVIAYLNDAAVQKALHVEQAAVATNNNGARGGGGGGGGWVDCGGSFGRPVRYTRVPQDERVSVCV